MDRVRVSRMSENVQPLRDSVQRGLGAASVSRRGVGTDLHPATVAHGRAAEVLG